MDFHLWFESLNFIIIFIWSIRICVQILIDIIRLLIVIVTVNLSHVFDRVGNLSRASERTFYSIQFILLTLLKLQLG